ncbi:MAG: hypothetical protein ABL995_11220 [Bryobacteraceae bacterium]
MFCCAALFAGEPMVRDQIEAAACAFEIVPKLATEAAATFRRLRYANIFPRQRDG